ncbi:major facilitator superfamily transporter [Colletotrichum graminicola]|uniref:Major facilitator superfamily transporter n=1 Tax=Colletotrichum graminicola (strain M1.001 / M2 / FGSC 10212) TaxID=645133 RepID=E3R0F0_COLGM|nr:major facilitator superfamily transporter [Colletotrichum graminicola M1.001]EFQ36588.1 major facilitator superfamily transporter [Colletotrichum graminicola M1.001]WDK19542.1 major facilitator superfamily transporter [Colletotrichum graminicola]
MFDAQPSVAPSLLTIPTFLQSRASTLAPSDSSYDDIMEKGLTISSSTPSLQNIHTHITSLRSKSGTALPAQTSITRSRKTLTVEDARHAEYPGGMKLALIVAAACFSVFLMALDNCIIATAIPRITDEFNSLNDVGWYGSACLLTTASVQLLFGKLYSFYSIKRIYLGTIGVFEIGSLVCGIAPNSITLILGRAVVGLGSAGIYAGALIILAHSVPLEKRPIYTGVVSSMWGISSVVGPLLGGFFTDNLTWRWCFYINLPVGAATVLVIILFFPDPVRIIPRETWRTRLAQMDPLGNLLFMPSVVCLLLALHWGGIVCPWSSARIISLLLAFCMGMLAFLYLQYHGQENATIPPRIFKKRTVWSSSLFSFNLGAAFLLSVYYLPIWFQSVQGVSAVNSGVRNLPMLVGNLIFSLVAGSAVTHWGYYTPFMLLSSVFMSIGYGLITTFSPETPSVMWIGYQIIAGVGVGVGMQQPLIAVQVVLDMADVATGTAIVIFAQQIGGAIFIAIGQTVFTNKLVERLPLHVPTLDPHSVVATGVTAIRKTVDAELLPAIAHAYSDALVQTFLVSTVAATATIVGAGFVEWKSVKGKTVQVSMG